MQRLAVDLGFEGAKTLIDRDQNHDRAPRIDQILERTSHLRKRVQDLVHRAKRDLAGDDGGSEQQIGEHDVSLQVHDAADVEVQEVQIEPKIVLSDGGKQHGQRWRLGAVRIVLAEHELLAVGGLDPLVGEFDSGQADANQRE